MNISVSPLLRGILPNCACRSTRRVTNFGNFPVLSWFFPLRLFLDPQKLHFGGGGVLEDGAAMSKRRNEKAHSGGKGTLNPLIYFNMVILTKLDGFQPY